MVGIELEYWFWAMGPWPADGWAIARLRPVLERASGNVATSARRDVGLVRRGRPSLFVERRSHRRGPA